VFPGLEKLQEWYLNLYNASTSFTVGHFDNENAGSNNFKSDIRHYKNVNKRTQIFITHKIHCNSTDVGQNGDLTPETIHRYVYEYLDCLLILPPE